MMRWSSPRALVDQQSRRVPGLDRVLRDDGRRAGRSRSRRAARRPGYGPAGLPRRPAPAMMRPMSTYRTDTSPSRAAASTSMSGFPTAAERPGSPAAPGDLRCRLVHPGRGRTAGRTRLRGGRARPLLAHRAQLGVRPLRRGPARPRFGMVQKFDFPQGVADCVASLHRIEELPEVVGGVGVIGFCLGGTPGLPHRGRRLARPAASATTARASPACSTSSTTSNALSCSTSAAPTPTSRPSRWRPSEAAVDGRDGMTVNVERGRPRLRQPRVGDVLERGRGGVGLGADDRLPDPPPADRLTPSRKRVADGQQRSVRVVIRRGRTSGRHRMSGG